jgi:hypothetical protein
VHAVLVLQVGEPVDPHVDPGQRTLDDLEILRGAGGPVPGRAEARLDPDQLEAVPAEVDPAPDAGEAIAIFEPHHGVPDPCSQAQLALASRQRLVEQGGQPTQRGAQLQADVAHLARLDGVEPLLEQLGHGAAYPARPDRQLAQ